MVTKTQQVEQEELIDTLRTTLKPGDTVYTVLRHVSRSGMYRLIDLYKISNNTIIYLSGYVGPLLEGRDPKTGACKASGCGMDMGFHLVYNLGSILFPDGFAVSGIGRNGDVSGWDRDGGYALRQSWL